MIKYAFKLFFITSLFISCVKLEQEIVATISPPEWIVGEWKQEFFTNVGYKFESHNLCEIENNDNRCYRVFLQSGQLEIVEQTYSDTSYKVIFHNISLTEETAEFINFEFIKINTNTIRYNNNLYYKTH